MNGSIIKQLRNRRSISQSELAKAVQMGTTAINNYENGHRAPNADAIIRLAEYFGTTTDFLLGRTNATSDEQYFVINPSDIFDGFREYAEQKVDEYQTAISELEAVRNSESDSEITLRIERCVGRIEAYKDMARVIEIADDGFAKTSEKEGVVQ